MPGPRLRFLGALIILLAALLLGAAPGGATGGTRESDFWQNLVDPGRTRFEAAMQRGTALLESLQGQRLNSPSLVRRIREDALAAFQEARRASPRNPKGWYFAADLLGKLGRTKECIAAFKRVRVIDPDFNANSIAFNLGIEYSKLGAFEQAVLEYERAERLLTSNPLSKSYETREDRSIIGGNAAEALMALGRLDEAIQRYQEALALGGTNGTLIRWGLAVAYDRDEQISKAQSMAQAAIALDPRMEKLTSESVFFIPEGDIHYYFALGYQVQGKLEESKKEWQRFLEQLPRNQWATRARAHLTDLGVAQGPEPRPGKRLAPVPRQRSGKEETAARDRDAVRNRVQGYLYRVRRCYQTEINRDKTLAGRLRISFAVDKNGHVQRPRVVSSTLGRPALHQCVLGVIRTISFSRPASGQTITVTYPLEFKP